MEPNTYSGKNVTTDNFFTILPLALKLLKKGTTLVGTVCTNKKELPQLAKQRKYSLPRFSSVVCRTKNAILTICKPSKKVILLSTKHN